MDIATSTVAAMKVLQVEAQGGTCPEGWIVDRDGNTITKPENGDWILSPIGGHKGYGFSFLIEVLCAVLSEAAGLESGSGPSEMVPRVLPQL
jgi:LDH2 family malate/lactate/ureidoglycolate dehydrogenase